MTAKPIKPKKGTYVSRSTFQKVVEENHKLKKDIVILVQEGMPSFEKLMTVKKWREIIKNQKNFERQIKDYFSTLQCKGAKCTIDNCVVCKNEMY